MDDRELEARLMSAFDSVEPSPEAADRMLAALQAAQAARDAEVVEATLGERAGADAAAPVSAGASDATAVGAGNPVLDSAVRKSRPRIRPVWKVVVPVAACLLAVAIVAGPLQGTFGGSAIAPVRGASQGASTEAVSEDAAAGTSAMSNAEMAEPADSHAVEADAPAANSAPSGTLDAPGGTDASASAVTSAPDVASTVAEAPASDEPAPPADGGSDAKAGPGDVTAAPPALLGSANVAQYRSIRLSTGEELVLELVDGAPTPVDQADVGALIERTTAADAQGGTLPCEVYAFATARAGSAPAYAVSFDGVEGRFLARAR